MTKYFVLTLVLFSAMAIAKPIYRSSSKFSFWVRRFFCLLTFVLFYPSFGQTYVSVIKNYELPQTVFAENALGLESQMKLCQNTKGEFIVSVDSIRRNIEINYLESNTVTKIQMNDEVQEFYEEIGLNFEDAFVVKDTLHMLLNQRFYFQIVFDLNGVVKSSQMTNPYDRFGIYCKSAYSKGHEFYIYSDTRFTSPDELPVKVKLYKCSDGSICDIWEDIMYAKQTNYGVLKTFFYNNNHFSYINPVSGIWSKVYYYNDSVSMLDISGQLKLNNFNLGIKKLERDSIPFGYLSGEIRPNSKIIKAYSSSEKEFFLLVKRNSDSSSFELLKYYVEEELLQSQGCFPKISRYKEMLEGNLPVPFVALESYVFAGKLYVLYPYLNNPLKSTGFFDFLSDFKEVAFKRYATGFKVGLTEFKLKD